MGGFGEDTVIVEVVRGVGARTTTEGVRGVIGISNSGPEQVRGW